MLAKFQILNFDTNLFGFKVAKILLAHLDKLELAAILDELKKQNVKLVYWASERDNPDVEKAAIAFKGIRTDEKVTYLADLAEIKEKINTALNKLPLAPSVKSYCLSSPNKELEELSLQIGLYSRFKNDPKLSEELWVKMYREWIKNSVNRSLAKDVLVYEDDGKIVGMITLGEKSGRGDIGLLAVAPHFRRHHLGETLVRVAQKTFIEEGYQFTQVVTRLATQGVCRLYEKCDYHIEKIENFYHFWL